MMCFTRPFFCFLTFLIIFLWFFQVCENEFANKDEAYKKSVVLYALVVIVSMESVTIFAVALCVTLRRKSDIRTCKNCKTIKKQKKHGDPVFSTNVNIYALKHKRSDHDLLTGPFYVEASTKGGAEIVTRHPPVDMGGFPLKFSKDVRYFECTPTPAKDSIHFETPPKEKIYEEIKR